MKIIVKVDDDLFHRLKAAFRCNDAKIKSTISFVAFDNEVNIPQSVWGMTRFGRLLGHERASVNEVFWGEQAKSIHQFNMGQMCLCHQPFCHVSRKDFA